MPTRLTRLIYILYRKNCPTVQPKTEVWKGEKMKILENEVEKKLVDKVKSLGGRAYKFVSPRQ